MFWDNEGMSDSLYLDGVICVVDGVFGLQVCAKFFSLGENMTSIFRPSRLPMMRSKGHWVQGTLF